MAKLELYRRYIQQRFHDEQIPSRRAPDGKLPRRMIDAAGPPLSGPAFNRAVAIFDADIADETERARVRGHMCMLSKFQFLHMLTDPNNPMVASSPGTVEKVCAAVLDDEIAHNKQYNIGMSEI